MIDEVGGKKSDKDYPIKTNFEELVLSKMKRKDMNREEACEDILKTSKKSNKTRDELVGAERRKNDE